MSSKKKKGIINDKVSNGGKNDIKEFACIVSSLPVFHCSKDWEKKYIV